MPDTGVVVFGARYSVYSRTVCAVLEEKGVAYRLHEVDVFGPGGPPPEHLIRHPFGRIPAFDHDGFLLYETAAITRYVDDAFAGPPLQPENPVERARMAQVIGICDAYAYSALIWDVYVERVLAPEEGRVADGGRIAAGLERSECILRAVEDLSAGKPYLAGLRPTLADFHLAPMMTYFRMTAEGADLLAGFAGLAAWWNRMKDLPSLVNTRFPRER